MTEEITSAVLDKSLTTKSRNKLLILIRDARLMEVDGIERALGISPTTAEIRGWFKKEKRGNNFEDWVRERSGE